MNWKVSIISLKKNYHYAGSTVHSFLCVITASLAAFHISSGTVVK